MIEVKQLINKEDERHETPHRILDKYCMPKKSCPLFCNFNYKEMGKTLGHSISYLHNSERQLNIKEDGQTETHKQY